MSDIHINIVTQKIIPPPPGYSLFKVTTWPIDELGLSTDKFGVGSFQVVPLWINETRTFSAVQNYSIIPPYDIQKLQTLQPSDGHTLDEKMGWLVYPGNNTRDMWTSGMGEWDTAPAYKVGTMLWGNQMFAATDQTFVVNTNIGLQSCRMVLPFRRLDWLKNPLEYPYLFPRATVALLPHNKFSDSWGKGEIRTMLQVLDPIDYRFAGGIMPKAFYIPQQWCLPA